jgi:CheY-like chemotaxis protein
MRILILEDDIPLQHELVELIKSIGHEPFPVINATEATELLKTTQIDVLITDLFVKMNEKFQPDGGLLLISRVRTNLNNELKVSNNAPILAITGASEQFYRHIPRSTTTALGADACLRKPMDPLDIVAWIESLSV